MREFAIPRDPNDMGVNIYKKRKITINEGVTVLVGCNGYGKSTLLRMIKQDLKDKDIPVIMFDNLQEGGAHARSAAGFRGDFTFLATAAFSSEGENIVMNLGNHASRIGKFIRTHSASPELWILLDAVDSGLSIDNVVILKEQLFKTILETNTDKSVYILISANEYELCRGEQCFDVHKGEYRVFKTYEAYRKFILKSADIKEEREAKLRRN